MFAYEAAKQEARRRRARGEPLKAIARGVGVSVSSVHKWTKDIELTAEQIERNRSGPGGPHNPRDVARRAYAWSRRCRNRRLGFQRQGRHRALEGDPLHLAGSMLYWAEGSKRGGSVQFSNSELPMVRLFRRFASECLEVPPEGFTVTLNVYLGNGLSLAEIEVHWLQGLGLPRSCLRKHTINHTPTSSSGRQIGKLPYGVCTLKVLGGTRILHHILGAVQEYAGFSRPDWAR
jgi:hypothetical protein